MLRVYCEVLAVIVLLRGVLESIERRDSDLARQMRRAAASVALNISEGSGSRGKNRGARYSNALGSMRETRACLDVAVALGYIAVVDAEVARQIDGICGSLYRLSH